DAAGGRQHPMELKKALARRITQDFHSEQAAREAEENWARQFQKDEAPENVETVRGKISSVSVDGGETGNTSVFQSDEVTKLSEALSFPVLRIDKILRVAGLADSGTDAQRKVKQGPVRIEGKQVES